MTTTSLSLSEIQSRLREFLQHQQQTQRSVGVNLPLKIAQAQPELYHWVEQHTAFLNHRPRVNFNERIWCVLHGITEPVLNAFGKPAKFININQGYELRQRGFQRQCEVAARRQAQAAQATALAKPAATAPAYSPAIVKFLKRNRRVHDELYTNPNLQAGRDYVVCPVSQARMLSMRTYHITHTLGLSLTEFNSRWPGFQRNAECWLDRARAAQHQPDPITGLTPRQISAKKTREKLLAVDESGLTGYAKKGQKTRATHMSRIDEQGRTGYQRQVQARLTTVLPNGLTVEQQAHIRQRDTIISRNRGGINNASRVSKQVLKPILDWLDQADVKYYFDKNEYGIKDPVSQKYYFWDLVIPDYHLAVEYQSHAWHADPTLIESAWRAWKKPIGESQTAEQCLKYDYDKARALYQQRAMVTFWVWEKTRDQDVREILCFLQTKSTKS